MFKANSHNSTTNPLRATPEGSESRFAYLMRKSVSMIHHTKMQITSDIVCFAVQNELRKIKSFAISTLIFLAALSFPFTGNFLKYLKLINN